MKKIFILFFLSFTFSAFCQVKISEMPAATDLTGAIVPIVQGGVNKKAASTLFTNISANIPSASISVGGITAGTSLTNLSDSQILALLLNPYVNPVFTSFSVSGQSQTVEATTTLSGARTFTWSIAANSGVVPTVTIYDNTTASDLLAGTPNDGSQSITITTIKLSTNGQTQSWRAIGNNTSPTSTFTSGNFDVTARFYLWHGAVSTVPTTSAGIRALPSNQFYVGGTTFTLNTGTLKDFMVALPIGRAITNVIDLDALNANITGQYVLQTPIAVVLADGTTTSTYSIYKNTIASAYSSNHRHQITIN